MDELEEIVEVLYYKWGMGLIGGVLIVNFILEEYSLLLVVIEVKIEVVLFEVYVQKIMGKVLIFFLFSRIEFLMEGDSLVVNIELVLNNVRLGV